MAAGLPKSAAAISASLIEPGTGNDEAARRALHGLAIWIGGNGTEAQRMAFAMAMEAAGERPEIGSDVKWFLKEQLRWARAVVPTIRRPGGAVDRTLETADLDALQAAANSATGFARTEAQAELFWAVAGLAAEGPDGRSRAGAWFRGFWLGSSGPHGSGNLRCLALSHLAELDPVGALKLVRDGLVDPAADVSACAEQVAIKMPGKTATNHWSGLAINRKEDADLRALAIRILGARGDATALGTIRKLLPDPSEDVRIAAIGALGALAGTRAVPDLLGRLSHTWTGEAKAATEALLAQSGPEALAAIAAGYPKASVAGRIAILEVLSARVAVGQLALAVNATDDPDPRVTAAALAAVGVLGGSGQLNLLIDRVTAASGDDQREAAVKSFVAIVKRMTDKDAAAKLVIAKLPDSVGAVRAALLSLLPRVGGEAALTAARQDLKNSDPMVREAAVRALAEWPDAAPLPDLFATACDAPESDHRVLAVRGAIKLSEKLDESAGRRAGHLANAYGLAVEPADRRLALAALGRTAHPFALAVARFARRDPALRDEALAAASRIARGIAPHRPAEARVAFESVLDAKPSDAVRKRATDGLKDLNACAGYLTAWEISDPYGREDLADELVLATPFDPETDPTKAGWRALTRDDESEEPCQLDFKHVHEVDHRAAYIRTTVVVPASGKYRLDVGSDDGVKVWVDGKLLHTNNTPRGVECSEDKIPVSLSAGPHTLLLKVANGEGGWGACVAMKTSSGASVPNLTSEIDLP